MKIDVTSPEDFYKYYYEAFVRSKKHARGTYIVVGLDGGNILVREILPGGGIGVLISWKFSDIEDEIFFGLPPLGMTVYKNLLFYIAQDFKRTGCRGLSRHRGRLYALSEGKLMDEYSGNTPITLGGMCRAFGFAVEALWPKYTNDFESGFSKLLSGEEIAVGIKQDFGGFLSDRFQHPILCYKNHKVGEILSERKVRILPLYLGFKDIVKEASNFAIEVAV